MSGNRQRCVQCGKALDSFDISDDSKGLCFECQCAQRDAEIAKTAESIAPGGLPLWVKEAVLYVVLIGLLIGTLANIPGLRASFAPLEPITTGGAPSGGEAAGCVLLLWKAARALQDTGSLGEFPNCPAGSKSYRVEAVGKTRVVRCPNPGMHGVSDISISMENPVPRVTE